MSCCPGLASTAAAAAAAAWAAAEQEVVDRHLRCLGVLCASASSSGVCMTSRRLIAVVVVSSTVRGVEIENRSRSSEHVSLLRRRQALNATPRRCCRRGYRCLSLRLSEAGEGGTSSKLCHLDFCSETVSVSGVSRTLTQHREESHPATAPPQRRTARATVVRRVGANAQTPKRLVRNELHTSHSLSDALLRRGRD